MIARSTGVCVYAHKVNGVVVYIGKGSPGRASNAVGRSASWHTAIGPKGLFEVEILSWHSTSAEALKAEARLIRHLAPAGNVMLNGYDQSTTSNQSRAGTPGQEHDSILIEQELRRHPDGASVDELSMRIWNRTGYRERNIIRVNLHRLKQRGRLRKLPPRYALTDT